MGVVLLFGCRPETVPMPGVPPLDGLLPDLPLGVRASDFRRLRPNAELTEDGIYVETIERHEVTYHFSPRAPDRPPPLKARLLVVESREEMYDSLRLWPQWHRVFAQLSASRGGAAAECELFDHLRATITTASFVDSVRVSIGAEIRRAPDGQAYEAFLVTRVGIGPLETTVDERRRRRPVECSSLVVGGRSPAVR